ncbi:MAG: two pore domain potassium channel family protein [Rhodobacteraceae bacterium]|uniref:ion channel n=1 Tax=Celeribacter sp. HF31 TaxID=2721558 RepID=UPI00142F54EF|nr:ion channel [Celeribacter sp. HF31]NIY79116.1 two pore domain potassium channel family protein [Celeribacter sp. HF31]NVK44880.1 two pore domain potassium channel family protein [Paracoccaceae bacterium]
MFIQIFVGSTLILLSVFVAALGFLVMELTLQRAHGWLIREPHRPKLAVVLFGAVIAVLWMITAGVWIWAIAFRLLGLFAHFEEALYFSLVAFTTLGFGDLLLPENWRLLGGFAATNGLLNIGMMTALLMEVLRHVRRNQLESRHSR